MHSSPSIIYSYIDKGYVILTYLHVNDKVTHIHCTMSATKSYYAVRHFSLQGKFYKA